MIACACGSIPTRVVDWHGTNHRTIRREVMCGPCELELKAIGCVVTVQVADADFAKVMAARPCWCDMRKLGATVPWCPDHGEHT